MAFNIIAETDKKLDYEKIHAEIFSDDLNFEFIPMPGFGLSNGDAIGICVPLKNVNELTWTQLKPVLQVLKSKFGCDVYDLYGGQKLGFFNIGSFKKNLFLK
jgi:hypothetical protein